MVGWEGYRLVQRLVHYLAKSKLRREGEIWGVQSRGETEMRLVMWKGGGEEGGPEGVVLWTLRVVLLVVRVEHG